VSLDIVVHPLLPWPLVGGLFAAATALLVVLVVRRSRGWLFRTLALSVLAAALLDPLVVRENRVPRPDLAVIVTDDSPSQSLAGRTAQTEAMLASLADKLARLQPELEVRVVSAGAAAGGGAGSGGGTRLFAELERAIAGEPGERLAGVLLITDGQVHDVPEPATALPAATPVHVLLTGAPDERDRRLVVDDAPAYGLVGAPATLRFHVDDRQSGAPTPVPVRIRIDGQEVGAVQVLPGRTAAHTAILQHAGPSVIEMVVDGAPGELSEINNRAVLTINGVRDRLKVLLVSGQPHAGERMWRNMLKSDPAVDLIHFTILRPPEKDDLASIDELSLIAFPVQELFEEKLYEFDLIVFDRYVLRAVLPFRYLARIAEYLDAGGALLLAVGAEFAGVNSLHLTPLGPAMPATPTGRVLEQAFRPAITELGRRHPVTAALAAAAPVTAAGAGPKQEAPAWGRWFRLAEAEVRSGTVVMEGAGGRPLLVVDRVGKGRIAQLVSDHLWLWARGYDGGGPHAELIRRLVHWLMKEPELEEQRLSARVDGGRLVIERQSLALDPAEVTVTSPSGAAQRLRLQPDASGLAVTEVVAGEAGLWRIDDGVLNALAAGGAADAEEIADLRATADRLRPLVSTSGGAIRWGIDGIPEVRRVRADGAAAGDDWIGFRRNNYSVVTGVREVALLPALLVLAAALAGLGGAWWREGR
jgi:hypothetical protein